ncbi:MAG TPA: GGDEF domain-containing protein, partial [Acetobacteraceae bacterium]|nr:GGDEF domain-containing protein [Acetobacteraceae bacterium]
TQLLYHSYASWWLCDSGGIFFCAPALVLWLGAEDAPRIIDHSGSLIDTLVLIVTVCAATLLFAVPGVGRLVWPEAVFLLTVPLAWITLRISLRAAYTLLTLIYIIAAVGTMMGNGPFHGPTIVNPLQSVGLMTVLFAMDSLTLIALTSERREAEARLAEVRGTLERAAQRTEYLRRESLTDPLTAIGNRRFFLVHAGAEWDRARAADLHFALVLLDLDHFKQVNDTGGHAQGDAALQAVARTLAMLTRKQDVLARIGGEEFAIALPDTPIEEALEIAERLRRTLLQIGPPGIGALPHQISASFGVAERTHDDLSLDDLLQRADAAVYAAKAKGRNRVELAAAQVDAGQVLPA